MLLKVLVISALLGPSLALASVGKIEKVGAGATVKVSRTGSALKLREGDALEIGDVLTTDANTAVDIRLADDSLIRVGVNSSYRVQEDSKLKTLMHRLVSGVVRVLVKPSTADHLNPAIKFRMQTPEGTIGVRGTEFVVIHSSGKTKVKGLDGEVLFGPAGSDLTDASTTVTVTRGFESEITANAPSPTKPQKFGLQEYNSLLKTPAGQFGPLAARTSGTANRYARSTDPAPAAEPPASVPGAPVKRPNAAAGSVDKGGKKPPSDPQDDLQLAAYAGDISAATAALKAGADVNGPYGPIGNTPLEAALVNDTGSDKMLAMVEFLLKKGADANARNSNQGTALMLVATEKLGLEYAKMLICAGANKGLVNKDGKTAAELALDAGDAPLANYLNSKDTEADRCEK